MRWNPPPGLARHPAALLAFFCYLLLTLALTYPALTRLSTGLIGPLGSNAYEGVWFVWWIGEALFRRGISPADIARRRL